MVSPRGWAGKPGADFHLCPALPPSTLYGNSRHLFSDGVSYSDGCTGEWLVSFLFNFVLLFDGRWDEILALSSPIQLKRLLDFVFPFNLKEQGNCTWCLNSSGPHIRKKPAANAGSCTLLTLPRGWGPWLPWRAPARCFCTLQPGVEDDSAWLLLWKENQPHFLSALSSRAGFLNWNYPPWAWTGPKGCMTICVLTTTLAAASCIHMQS